MRRIVIIGGIASIAFVLVGFGIWQWRTRTQRAQAPTSSGGSVSLSTEQRSGDQASELKVSGSDTGQLSVGGNNLTGNENSSTSQTANTPKEITPKDFKQFDQYKTSQNAMYMDLKKGEGAEVKSDSKLAVHYRGWLTDGRLFDESAKDKPFIFAMGQRQVIVGWEQGMVGMKIGGQRLLIIPPSVGYGSQGKDPIPPDSVLVFAVEVLGVE